MEDIVLRSSDNTASVTLEGFRLDSSGGAKFTFVVCSRGFAARSAYALEPEEVGTLVTCIQKMLATLSGTAEIRLHMEEEHIALAMESTGRVLVRGVIVHYVEPQHRLEFGFHSDQSCLAELLRGLVKKTAP